jgi:hypothetical protein
MKEMLTDHISMKEATFSVTAERTLIPNEPNSSQLDAMLLVAEHVFEPLREHFGVPIGVTSFFRSSELNAYLRGSKTSQHCKGEAMDVDADVYGKITNRDIFMYIWKNLDFDQLIWEFGTKDEPAWIHVSFKAEGNRKQILRATKVKQEGGYVAKYITYNI